MISGQVQIGDEPFLHDPHNTLVLSSAPDQPGVLLTRPSKSTLSSKSYQDDQSHTNHTPATTSTATHLVLIAGEPLNQRVIQYGPFVVNTAQQVQDAFTDFRLGRNGFENAPGWESEIGKVLRG